MKRILLIDDDYEFRTMLKMRIENAGYEVVEAENGRKGLELYQPDRFDLVVTDVFMPEKEGIETIMELKEKHNDVSVIGISGGGVHREYGYLDSLQDFGVERTFKKPIPFKEFIQAIKELTEP